MTQEELAASSTRYLEAWKPPVNEDPLPYLFIQLPADKGMSVFNDDIFKGAMLWMSR